jgi:hypothetical protein
MAIGYESEPSYFAANPKIVRITGVLAGSRGTFVCSVNEQQNDPTVGHYNETVCN